VASAGRLGWEILHADLLCKSGEPFGEDVGNN